MFEKSRIYTIATAHLDTVWNWDFEHVITVCLHNTLYDNFALFEKYPNYRFNFEGSYRYELFEEYYPEEFKKMTEYVNQGKWNVTGSAFENGDVNVPSPESLFRNILYGNRYFRQKFGKKSNDIFLPDCFGFGYALPSVIAHSNLKGFSTQKLTWGGAYDRPFDIGYWQGVDGSRIIASLDARSYCMTFKQIRSKPDVAKKLSSNIKNYGLNSTFVYHGVGDVGGAPKEKSVITVEEEMNKNSTSDIDVLSSSPTEFFDDIDALSFEEKSRLPVWNNELVMTDHGVGSYTSRAFSKRMNRRNEELADMAERASVIASSVCSFEYPQNTLEKAWKRTIAHTFHDDITGTSVQRVYKRSWNDLVASANQFSSVYDGACSEIIRNLDTSWAKGNPIVVSNMLEFDRTGVVDFTIPAAEGFSCVRVFDVNGTEIPSQVISSDDKEIKACALVNVKAMGFNVYDVLYSYEPCKMNTGLRSEPYIIENFKYQVIINKNGDIGAILDKTCNNKQILAKPIRFELNKYKGAHEYAAWEMRYKEINKYPWEFAEKGVTEVVESGPCRVTIKVTQKCHKSTFIYYVSLTAGGQYVSVYNEIEWREFCRALHNGFSFNVKNNTSTYDLGLGCIERGIANKKLYSVPAQKWADISDKNDDYGVSVFSDSKYGWIMKDEKTLRLTVIHTPKNYYRDDSCQGMLEFGLNRYGYAIYAHQGKDLTMTQRYAKCFNQPMAVFTTNKHEGALGTNLSFIKVSDPSVIVRAVKKNEDNDEIVIRVNEGTNKPAENVVIELGNGILSAKEIFASEEFKNNVELTDGKLVISLKPYEIRSFSLTLKPCRIGGTNRQSRIELPYNINIMSAYNDTSSNEIPVVNASIPVEQIPSKINCCSIDFNIKNDSTTENAVISNGQTIKVNGNRLYLICASTHGDKAYNFGIGDTETGIHVQSINERIGAWDLYEMAETGYIKKDVLALECTHTISNGKINPAAQLYFFMYEINIDEINEIKLPNDPGLLILAATEVFENRDVKMITDLYDSLEKRPFDYKMSMSEKRTYKHMKRRWKKTPNKS